ncbi:MAG TPA: flagellar biosynthesis protein FlhB [Alphaproteobacteria bacterium]|nr:flagellar biosynthesis protein FlhB [Alphaproteobacteria bacterium]
MAEDDDDSQKTEDPTAKRLSEARSQGNLPLSRDFSTWVVLLGMVMTVSFLLPIVIPQILMPLQAILAKAGEIPVEPSSFTAMLGEIFGKVAFPLLSVLALLTVMGLLGWIIQTGPLFNMSLLRFKWERLNPMEGIKKIFSSNSLFELVKSVAKIIVIGVVVYTVLRPAFMGMESMSGLDNMGMVATTYNLAARIFFAILLVFTIVALADLLYQRFTYFKNLRMTRNELKEEFRQTEGDPQIKQRLRQIRTEKARKRMMAAVPKADVVITNPTHYAIALKYDAGVMTAPVVLAKGQDFIAMKIREIAEEHKIPLVSNPPLARTLYATVEIDDEIPPQHYRAVAEIISYVFRLKKNIRPEPPAKSGTGRR